HARERPRDRFGDRGCGDRPDRKPLDTERRRLSRHPFAVATHVVMESWADPRRWTGITTPLWLRRARRRLCRRRDEWRGRRVWRIWGRASPCRLWRPLCAALSRAA